MFVGHRACPPESMNVDTDAITCPAEFEMKHGDRFASAHCPDEKHLHADAPAVAASSGPPPPPAAAAPPALAPPAVEPASMPLAPPAPPRVVVMSPMPQPVASTSTRPLVARMARCICTRRTG